AGSETMARSRNRGGRSRSAVRVMQGGWAMGVRTLAPARHRPARGSAMRATLHSPRTGDAGGCSPGESRGDLMAECGRGGSGTGARPAAYGTGRIWTIGHSTGDWDELLGRVGGPGREGVADVR